MKQNLSGTEKRRSRKQHDEMSDTRRDARSSSPPKKAKMSILEVIKEQRIKDVAEAKTKKSEDGASI